MLFDLLVAVLILGLVAFICQTLLPEPFRRVALVVCVVILIVYMLQLLRLGGPLRLTLGLP